MPQRGPVSGPRCGAAGRGDEAPRAAPASDVSRRRAAAAAEATFSIVARCPTTGAFGAAVASRVPAVGAVVPHLRGGVGGVVTQARTNVYIGIRGLESLAAGATAEAVRAAILRWDPEVELRQFAVVDANGGVAAFTGGRTEAVAGQRLGEGYAVVGNMLAAEAVLDAMAAGFEAAGSLPLAERLLTALVAGQAAGGDKRGKQSAAVRVVEAEEYPWIDLRVDEHTDPIEELRRIYRVCQTEFFAYARTRPSRAWLRAATGREGPEV